jgi:hypothetical protein
VVGNSFGVPNLSQWYFLLAWHDATNDLIWLSVNNATPQSTAWTYGTFNGTGEFRIGGDQGGAGLFEGRIDEVAIWSRVLTSDERTALFNAGAGKYYPFA